MSYIHHVFIVACPSAAPVSLLVYHASAIPSFLVVHRREALIFERLSYFQVLRTEYSTLSHVLTAAQAHASYRLTENRMLALGP
ncbi:hypothetical protein KCU81_g484, partial [Aureobasidium melanogenum]